MAGGSAFVFVLKGPNHLLLLMLIGPKPVEKGYQVRDPETHDRTGAHSTIPALPASDEKRQTS